MQNNKMKILFTLIIVSISGYLCYRFSLNVNPNPDRTVGQKLDSLNGVYIYYNGGIRHTDGRNLTPDGYNLGLKYQCVEFVKRYYYEFYRHKMPDTYGNAKDFFDATIADGKLNPKRNLLQFTHPSLSCPKVGDLLIFDGHAGNPYGHVAIVSAVNKNNIEIIQQNPGPFASSRVNADLKQKDGKCEIDHSGILGWLRMK